MMNKIKTQDEMTQEQETRIIERAVKFISENTKKGSQRIGYAIIEELMLIEKFVPQYKQIETNSVSHCAHTYRPVKSIAKKCFKCNKIKIIIGSV